MVRPGDPRFDPALVEPPDEDMHFVAVTRPYTESVYVDRDYYVQTISDEDETVVAFSVTTRSPRFAPCFEIPQRRDAWAPVLLQRLRRRRYRPLFRICLGRTRFSELGPGVRPSDDVVGPMLEANVGARFASYSETEYFGNPGYYQTYVFTAGGGAGHMRHFGDIVAVTREVGYEWPSEDDDRRWRDLVALREFRRFTAITTYTVIGAGMDRDGYPALFGPRGDDVRTIP